MTRTAEKFMNGCFTDPRLQGLEKKILIKAGETPAVVYEMKKQVDSFREKLEVSQQSFPHPVLCCLSLFRLK